MTALELLAEVPRPPGDSVVVGATEQQLHALSARLGRPLPAELSDWLMLCNGVMAGPGGIYGAEQARASLDIATELSFHPQWAAKGWIPLAGDGNGDCYVVDASRVITDLDPVLFIDQAEQDVPAYVVASGVGQFLMFLLNSELGERRWPFDEAFVTGADPDIRQCPASLLPWHAG